MTWLWFLIVPLILCIVLLIPIIIIMLDDENNDNPSINLLWMVPFVGPIIFMQIGWTCVVCFRNKKRLNKLGAAIDDWNKYEFRVS